MTMGKRTTEDVTLGRKDVQLDDNYLTINFIVLKKKTQLRYRKQITLRNAYTTYILRWIEVSDSQKPTRTDPLLYNSYIFAGRSEPKVFKVRTKHARACQKYVAAILSIFFMHACAHILMDEYHGKAGFQHLNNKIIVLLFKLKVI